jgi:DMSO reductase family type II enzyme heme b subunit
VWGEIVRALKSDSVPDDPFAPAWDEAPALDVRLAGQLFREPRLFNPSIQSVTAQALFDGKELALLLTWNDRFENRGGDGEPGDQLLVLFPAQQLEAGTKPYFLMGDRKRPVDGWQWSAAAGTETFLARGLDAVTPRASPVTGKGVYRDGQYRVILRRNLGTSQDDEVAFSPGLMIPIAFNVWDGENAEVGNQRAISRWYYLLLEPETPWTIWLWPLVVVILAAGGEVFGLRRLRQHWASQQADAPAPPGVSPS